MSLLSKLHLKSQRQPCLAVGPRANQSTSQCPWAFVVKCRCGTDLSGHWRNMK